MFDPLPNFRGPFEIFEGHILPSVKHNPIPFFLQKLNLSLLYAGTKLALKFREKNFFSSTNREKLEKIGGSDRLLHPEDRKKTVSDQTFL